MKGAANQRLAADPNASAWVSANAGTGKTHVLIDRISRLLLAGARPEKLLCLTFTKAAAAEMADRLNGRLAQWARASDKDLKKDLRDLTGAAHPPDDLAPARRLFAEVLEAPGGLKIRTIHSFCESLLGRFPLEAGVSPHFSVLDDRTAAELLDEARDRLLLRSQRPGGEDMANALKTLAGMVGEEGFAKLKKELTFRRGLFAKQLGRAGGVDALIDAAYGDLGVAPGETEEDVIAPAVADGAFDAKGLRMSAEALAGGSRTDAERAKIIGAWLSSDAEDRKSTFISVYAPVFLKKDGDAKLATSVITKNCAEANPKAQTHLLAEQARLLEINERLRAVRVAQLTSALLRFGSVLLEEYEALKSARALLDYDDLILKAAGLLESSGGVSWVHYKLDGGIDHILIDEAQDTSPEQWEVIRRIADDFYSGLGAQEPNERTVFAVGDEKQSIYSFQGADPEGFHRMCAYFREKAADAAQQWREVDLIESYRSTPDILKAVDQVFATVEAADGVRRENEEIRHHVRRMGQAGLVEIWPTVKPAEEPSDSAWDDPVDHMGADAPAVVLAGRIAGRIKGWIDGEEILPSQNRPLSEGDIMILVRKRGAFADAMIRALKVRGVPVAGSDRMKLMNQLAVMDLMSLGHFALAPEDDLTLAEVLKGPFIGFDDRALYDVAFGRSDSLWRALREKAQEVNAYARAVTFLKDILNRADYAPPFEFYAHALGAKDGRRAIQKRLGHEAVDPMDEFMNLALDFERAHTPSLQGFLHWIAGGETEVKRDLEAGRQEVRVLTVHGSKGLEANVVFLPDTLSMPDKRLENSILWSENAALWPAEKSMEPEACRTLREAMRRREHQEYRRLLYVAMTRARDRLYICGFEGKRERGEGCWYDLARSAIEAAGKTVEVPVLGFDAPGLRMASPQQGEPEKPGEEGAAGVKSLKPPPWAYRPPPEEPSPPRPLAPSRPSEEEPPVRAPLGQDNGARFKRGTLIHRLLQSLPDLEPEKRGPAAKRFLARPAHGLSDEEQREIATETLAVLETPDFAPLFGPGSRAEVDLSGDVSGYVISARIDRLRITPEQVSVIDYKTNRTPPQTAEQTSTAYLKQMAAYRQALRLVYPDREVRCLLLWTDGPKLMELPNSLLDRHAP